MTEPHVSTDRYQLYIGKCFDVLKDLPDNSVDAICTDPPYGISFMGKKWDYQVPSVEEWKECLRVLKPGGHLLSFAGTRTQHRMAVNIEGAGFEIRDMIAWVYGSGMPKSHNISKAIDKAAGVRGHDSVGFNVAGKTSGFGVIQRPELRSDHPDYIKPQGITPEAQQWEGWGTALKPCIETVTWATKPFPSERKRGRILANLWKIEARLWLLSSASAAAQSSTSSPSEYVAACATAQWTADDATNTRAALRGLMDTWQCEMATHMSLSIVSSWRRTLEESSKPGSTSTTETESSTTTDWKTLSCCLSQITPESIIQACSLPGGFNANASTAAQIFNASLALLQSTLTLSAIEPATWQELGARQGEDVQPSLDPVILARKPLEGTVAANVLQYGTGGINIDGCRVQAELPKACKGTGWAAQDKKNAEQGYRPSAYYSDQDGVDYVPNSNGRWPANFCHDSSDEVVGLFPQTGISRGGNSQQINSGTGRYNWNTGTDKAVPDGVDPGYGDSGSAARFFYSPKASKKDKNEGLTTQTNNHPTVKPTELMRYLCRLITPPGGTVLDPWVGSGSTGKAALLEGFNFIGIDMEKHSINIAAERIEHTYNQIQQKG